METWFVQAMKMVDRKLLLLGSIVHVYRQMEETMVDVNPLQLTELIYEGDKVISELKVLLDEEHAWLHNFSQGKGEQFLTLKAVALSCNGRKRQKLLAGCAKIDQLVTRVQQYSGILADDLRVMDLLNKRYSDFFQQVCPVNLGYQSSGLMNHAGVVFRGNGLNHQV